MIDWCSQSPGGGPAWRPGFISEQLFFVSVDTDLTNEIIQIVLLTPLTIVL